ncbi:cytochrome P450 [Xylariaceae sp. FL0255]|nr:cytochrome P450 [Xylariaceae sp. FL0255]
MDHLLLLVLLGLGYAIVVGVYRIYLHPLAKIPGPFLTKVSGFPAYYYTLKKDRHIWLWRLHQKYGPVVRIAPGSITFNTPDAYKTIYGSKSNIQKGQYYKVYPREVGATTTWNCIERSTHIRKKQVLATAFSDKALRTTEPFIHTNVDRWCELLSQEIKPDTEWSQSLNMADLTTYLVFDIMGDLCFGKCFNMKEPCSELRSIPSLMESFIEIMHPIAFSPFVSLWVFLKPRGLDRLLAATVPQILKNWEQFVAQCFTERTQVEEQLQYQKQIFPESAIRKDFFHYLFQARDPVTGRLAYTKAELLGETENLIVAGSDTTATAIAAALFYLARNLDIQSRLAEEMKSTFSDFGEITTNSNKLYDCAYLRAFTKETLRMSPPGPADLAREVVGDGLVIGGLCLPPGTTVSTASYCMHYNEAYYDKPFTFNPDRWIVDREGKTGSSAEQVARAESCFTAFSTGPRVCIGKNLAYLEMYIVIAKIVYQFEIRQDKYNNLGGGGSNFDARDGRHVEGQYQLFDIFTAMRDGPVVQLRYRLTL